ncbi:hypothetical protein [Bradyrhizobium sp. NAS96.2]|uniref:hypothetical protein n=1 Tax=Bradyrhizobium sp. NAS96.2 TaxID=1680160 RepID=UPI00093DFFD6|nr:hypothetical protein [Bradyrhizobium sp. NAS96.2]OKO76261.1 hypothetical protein AC628_18540 [Bradyrhizobium sp. NAS96.2]
MQIRPKAYLHLISLWRLLRNATSPSPERVPAKASPGLIFTAIVLALLLAILEISAHRDELQSLGLVAGDQFVAAALWGP